MTTPKIMEVTMNAFPRCVVTLCCAALLLLTGSAATCSPFLGIDLSEDDPEGITLVNLTSKPLIYLAYELEASRTVDPNPRFKVRPDQERLIQPGASALVEAEEIHDEYSRGDDVRFFLHEVNGDEATFEGLITLTHKELGQVNFRVEITHL